MKVLCPKCGEEIDVQVLFQNRGQKLKSHGIGRKPLDLGFVTICDTLRACGDVSQAADTLGCSRAYLYKAAKDNGTTVKEILLDANKGTSKLSGNEPDSIVPSGTPGMAGPVPELDGEEGRQPIEGAPDGGWVHQDI